MRILAIKLTDEEYKALEERARKEGYVLLSEYARKVLLEGGECSPQQIDVSVLASKLERKVQDVLMPFTSEIETIKKQVAQLIEIVDSLTKQEIPQEKPQPQREKYQEKKPVQQEEKEKKRTAIDVLREQGVVYESELSLKNPDAFFTKLENEGAKIIITEKERIAVYPDFYNKFLEDLSKITSSDTEEASSRLDPKEAKLFRKLASDGLVYYDAESKSWKLLV